MAKKILIITTIIVALIAGAIINKNLLITKAETAIKLLKPKEVVALDSVFSAKFTVYDSSLSGYMLISSSGPKCFFGSNTILDMKGKTIWQQNLNCPSFDFRQWIFNGKRFYSYGTDDKKVFHNKKANPNIPAGYYYILDSSMNQIKKISLIAQGNIKLDSNPGIDPHDFIMLSENHYILLAGYEQNARNIPANIKVSANKRIVSTVIQEVENDKVIWQWDASDYSEFFEFNPNKEVFSDDEPADYLHTNTITLDTTDGNIIMSFRDLNQIIKLERRTGKILWRLGGLNSDFALTKQMKFLGQHAVKFASDHSLLFLDNGSDKTRPYSRIVKFKLDEKGKKVVQFEQYKIPQMMIPTRGSVFEMNSNYLICGGVSKFALIVDPKSDDYKLDVRTNYDMYRVYWVPTVGDLSKLPH